MSRARSRSVAMEPECQAGRPGSLSGTGSGRVTGSGPHDPPGRAARKAERGGQLPAVAFLMLSRRAVQSRAPTMTGAPERFLLSLTATRPPGNGVTSTQFPLWALRELFLQDGPGMSCTSNTPMARIYPPGICLQAASTFAETRLRKAYY